MRLLILGGTVFLGRHLVEAALAHGHELTLFNRGQRNPELFPEVEKLRGDRDGGLDVLKGRSWDAVVDTCGYLPRIVRSSAELLADAVQHYTFISSISVYKDFSRPAQGEEAPVGTLEDETVEQVTGETYGPLKALCEQAAEQALPGRVLVVRPGLIVGPHDPTDRFTYWPWRVAQGGEVLAPGKPELPIEYTDVRDLSAWILSMVEAHKTGTYNVSGPGSVLSMGALLERCRVVGGSDASLTWVAQAFLLEAGVQPWGELPLWVAPEDNPEMVGFASILSDRAIANGLTFRPLDETIRDTLAWAATRPADHEWRAGLKREREAELLRDWHARQ
jgi:2'-hydroxyisoflavone reductase